MFILSQHKSPIDAKFNSSKMRSHLLQCLLEDKVTEFPRTEHAISKYFEKTIKVCCPAAVECRGKNRIIMQSTDKWRNIVVAEDSCTECVKEFLLLFSRKKVKIGTVFNVFLMKKFSIWKFDTLFLRCYVRDIQQLIQSNQVQTALDFNASYVKFFFTCTAPRAKM